MWDPISNNEITEKYRGVSENANNVSIGVQNHLKVASSTSRAFKDEVKIQLDPSFHLFACFLRQISILWPEFQNGIDSNAFSELRHLGHRLS